MLVLSLTVLSLVLSNSAFSDSFETKLIEAAIDRTSHSVRYDGAYHSIGYPGGDVPATIGVCTDVVIRTYRAIGYDLQKLVHEDMRRNFAEYPSKRIWGLSTTDRNIDHRRVPNLQVFFTRKGHVLPITQKAEDYAPGDLVTWFLPGNLPHIGFVSDRVAPDSGNPMIVHNIGAGPQLQDMLFKYPITGHYKYDPINKD